MILVTVLTLALTLNPLPEGEGINSLLPRGEGQDGVALALGQWLA